MRSLRVTRWIVLAALVAAIVAVTASAATATFVQGAGFATGAVEVPAVRMNWQGMAPWRPTAADLDLDGFPDLVCGSAMSTGGIGIAMSYGGTQYSVMTTIGLGQSVNEVLVEDIDRDGKPDILAKMYSGVLLWTMTGNGDGTFDQPLAIVNSWGYQDVVLADMNNDGIKDLLSSGTRIAWRFGNGTNGFNGLNTAADTQNLLMALDVDDVDRDGYLDIATVDYQSNAGRLLLYRGNGTGFSLVSSVTVDGTSTSAPTDVAFLQTDTDPQPEIVVCTGNSGTTKKLDIFNGTGVTDFTYAGSWQTTIPNGGVQLEVGDVDQDGWEDVMVSEWQRSTIRGFDNDGSGTFTERYSWTAPVALTNTPFSLADADGDERLDIIAGYSSGALGTIGIAENILPAKARRIFGPNRYATGAAASASAVTTSNAVVIATGSNFPDALSAAGLCGALRAPLLLVGGSVPASVTAEIQRLQATKAYIVGGSSSVSTDVADALEAAPLSLDVTRVAGDNRYHTSRLVAAEVRRLAGGPVPEAFIAKGDNFPDALAAAPIAYYARWPILLTKTTVLSADASAALAAMGATRVDVLGSKDAVSDDVFNALAGRGYTVTRIAGGNRYATAAAVADFGVHRGVLLWRHPYVATGANFPDALAGGAAAGALRSPLLLTPTASLAASATAALHDARGDIADVRILGGTGSVSDTALGQAGNALK